METIVKKCITCKQVKCNSHYDKKKGGRHGTRTECRACRKIRRQRPENREQNARRCREYKKNNSEKVAKAKAEYYQRNKEHFQEYQKRYNEENKDKVKARQKRYSEREDVRARRRITSQIRKKARKQEDPAYKMRELVSCRIYQCLADGGHQKGGSVFQALPYTPQQLKEHIEAQFEDWMTWDNHGTWHIDHIYPQSRLPYDSLKHPNFQKCWALENLRPLCAIENLRKSDKIVETETSYREPIEKEE